MKNKKILIILALIILLIVIVACIIFFNNNTVEEINSTIGQATWLNTNESLKITNGDDEIILVINSDLNFDDESTEYRYEVPYTLKVNGQDYSGSHTFSNGYSIHSEDNDMPYNVNMLDIKNGSIEVEITEK